VLRLSNSVARISAMRLWILPYLNLSAGHLVLPSVQNRKELLHAWEVVGHFWLCHLNAGRNPSPQLTLLWRGYPGKSRAGIHNRFYKFRLRNRRRWWSLPYNTCSENRLCVWDFPIVGNTKSVTIGFPVLLGEFRWSRGKLAFSGSSPYKVPPCRVPDE